MIAPRKRVTRSQSAKKTRGAVTRKTALELRLQGLTFEVIGARLGVSRQAAHAAVTRELDALAAETRGAATTLRDLELARLDAMLAALWPAVKRGSQGAVDKALKIGARRARLLGLDVPVKIDASIDGLADFLGQAFGEGEPAGGATPVA